MKERLDVLLVKRNLADSREKAKALSARLHKGKGSDHVRYRLCKRAERG